MTREPGSASSTYHSFLLRLWRENERSAWRASLESAITGERRGFPNLASLIAFLQGEYPEAAAPPQENSDEQKPII